MIPALITSLLAVVAFGLALWKSGIVGIARASISTAFSGLSAMTDTEMDDDAKERAVRRAALSLLWSALLIAVCFAIMLAAAAVPIVLADLMGIVSTKTTISLMSRLDYILIVSIVGIVCGEGLRRWYKRKSSHTKRSKNEDAASVYSDVDRFLHGIAFSSPTLQKTISRLEDVTLGKPRVQSAPPIFVTSLARGGTTALLNALSKMKGIATHTYRDMPFVTAPVLWNTLAGGDKRHVARRRRAHGDGLMIDLNSPEAFEEVLWKIYWPEKYRADGITLWTEADKNPEADLFIARHMHKIIRARFGQSPQSPVRYCSKNNTNIGRLAYLPKAFPGCTIIIPLRQPGRHAASLHRQHQNFLNLQAKDDFIRRYMRDIGHFEFGKIYTPLKFPNFDASHYEPNSANHWLYYWICAFQAVEDNLSADQRFIFVTQDSLRQHPKDIMHKLTVKLNLPLAHQLFETEFLSTSDKGCDDIFDAKLLKNAQDIYTRLSNMAL